jgi:hypothetical protein
MGTKKIIKQLNNVVSNTKSDNTKQKDTKEIKRNNKQPDNQVYKGGN